MKYALLLCLLPFLVNAQYSEVNKPSKFSIGLEAGMVTTYMNVRDYNSYHELCCFGYDDDDPDSAPTVALLSKLRLDYRFDRTHQIGLGLQFSQYGESHDITSSSRQVLNYTGFTINHQLTLIAGKKSALAITNSFNLDYPLFENRGGHYLKGISHEAGLTWRWVLNPVIEIQLSGIFKTAITQYNPISWMNDNHRYGYGFLIGLSHRL